MTINELRSDAPEAETIRVSSFRDFYELMANLHDCWFDLEEATFDETDSTWTGAFLRPLWQSSQIEMEETRRLWGLLKVSRYRVPAARATVRVRNVAEVHVLKDQGIQTYMFNEIKLVERGVRVQFCEAMDIDLILANGLDVTYDEEALPNVRLTYTNLPFGAQTGPGVIKT